MAPVPYFEEKQRYPQWIPWIGVFIGMGIAAWVVPVFVDRLNNGKGDLGELLAVIAGIIILIAVLGGLFAVYRLTIAVDQDGISYLYFPTFLKPKRIPTGCIVSFEVRELSFSEIAAEHPKKKSRKEVCVLYSWTVADLELSDGSHVILGTTNPDGLRWALKKLQSSS